MIICLGDCGCDCRYLEAGPKALGPVQVSTVMHLDVGRDLLCGVDFETFFAFIDFCSSFLEIVCLLQSLQVWISVRSTRASKLEVLPPTLCTFSMYYSRMVHVVTSILAFSPSFILASTHDHSKDRIGSRANDAVLNQHRADAVKSAFQVAWDGYKEYAFPHDELHPVTNTFGDSRYV
jgi:hypothetical protein